MSNLYNVSASPHVRSKDSTKTIMRDVVIALLPACLAGIWVFKIEALLVLLTTSVTCLLTEYIYERLMKRRITTGDYSALVTGLLLGMNLPPSIPLWIAVLGSVFAILVVKQLFGGLGQNFMNPALGARCFLMISFTGRMTSFTLDGVSSATPLAIIKNAGGSASVVDTLSENGTSLLNMFLGNIGGTIGETSALAILIGAAYLFLRKIISWEIPVCYIGVFSVFMLIFGGHGFGSRIVWWWIVAWRILYGYGLCYKSDYKEWKDYFWCLSGNFNRNFSCLWRFCGRCIICNHFLQSVSSID